MISIKIYFNDPILLTNLSVSLTALSMKNDVPNLSKLDISSLNSSSVVSLWILRETFLEYLLAIKL